MSDLRILVVEDNQNWQDALKEYLQRLKIMHKEKASSVVHVDSAFNFDQASRYIEKEKYDLMIVDLALNGNSPDSENASRQGMDLLQVVRQSSFNKDCGLIVLTSRGDITTAKQALKNYGVYDYIEKDKFSAESFVKVARATLLDARLKTAEAKARARLRLTITFNQEYLVGSELTGPARNAVYSSTNHRRLKTDELIRRADKLNILVSTGQADLWRPEVRSLGKAIHDALFKEQSFQTGLITAQTSVQHPSDLWLQFRGSAKDLGIPFELLRSGDDYLSRNHLLTRQLIPSSNPFLRRSESFLTFLTTLLMGKETLRILIVGANIDKTIPAAETEAIALKMAIKSDLQQLGIECEVTTLLGVEASYDKVSEALRNGRYHIFHYAGHGLYDETLPEVSGLILHKNNDYRVLTAADLNTLTSNTELRLVFLSCCLGARNASHIGRGDFYGMLEAIATAGVPMVLGYRWTVLDNAAMHLSEVFYETLWYTFSPGEALLKARIAATLGPKGLDDETWASPVLIMQDG